MNNTNMLKNWNGARYSTSENVEIYLPSVQKLSPEYQALKAPLNANAGWRRVIVVRRAPSSSNKKRDIYYFTPGKDSKKLRSLKDLKEYLKENQSQFGLENFSFNENTFIGVGEPYEEVKRARERLGKIKKSSGVNSEESSEEIRKELTTIFAGNIEGMNYETKKRGRPLKDKTREINRQDLNIVTDPIVKCGGGRLPETNRQDFSSTTELAVKRGRPSKISIKENIVLHNHLVVSNSTLLNNNSAPHNHLVVSGYERRVFPLSDEEYQKMINENQFRFS